MNMRIAYNSKGKFQMSWLETLTMRRRLEVSKYLGEQLEAEAREMEKLTRKMK